MARKKKQNEGRIEDARFSEHAMTDQEVKKESEQTSRQQGAQMDLIDVSPENIKAIVAEAKRYKVAQQQRIQFGNKEAESKQKILALLHDAKLQRLDDGKIRFQHDGLNITVTPRDEKVTVKLEDEEE